MAPTVPTEVLEGLPFRYLVSTLLNCMLPTCEFISGIFLRCSLTSHVFKSLMPSGLSQKSFLVTSYTSPYSRVLLKKPAALGFPTLNVVKEYNFFTWSHL